VASTDSRDSDSTDSPGLIPLHEFLGDFAVYTLGRFVRFGLSYFALIPILTRELHPQEYAIVATLESAVFLLLAVLQFGLPSAVLRFFFLYDSEKDRRDYLGTVWIFSFVTSFSVVFSILAFGSPWWDSLIHNAPFKVYARYVVWGAFFRVLSDQSPLLFRAQGRAKLYVLFNSTQVICLVGLVWYHVSFLHLGALGQVRATFLAYAISGAVSVVVFLRNVSLQFRWQYLWGTLRFAVPVFFAVLFSFLSARANVLVLQHLLTEYSIGIFAIGQQFGNLITITAASLEIAWQPFLYQQSLKDGRVILSRFMSVTVPGFTCLFLLMGLFAPEIIAFFTSDAYADAWIVVVIVGGGAALTGISSLINHGILYAKRSDYSTFVSFAGMLANIVSLLILTPRWGIVGASFASVFSGFCVLLLSAWGMHRFFGAELDYIGSLSALGLGVLGFILSSWLVRNLDWPFIALLAVKSVVMVLYVALLGYNLTRRMPRLASSVHNLTYLLRSRA
jgi:O-antigen/teichoic acid export membrane protein